MSPRGGPAIVTAILFRFLSQIIQKTKASGKVRILNMVLAALLEQTDFKQATENILPLKSQ